MAKKSSANGTGANGTPSNQTTKEVIITQGQGYLVLASEKGSLTVHRGQCQGEQEQRFFDSYQSTNPRRKLLMSYNDRLQFATIAKRPIPASALTPSEWAPPVNGKADTTPIAPPAPVETETARKESNRRAERGVQGMARTTDGTHLSRLSNAHDSLKDQDLYIFWYYIPAELSRLEVDNPSDMLWNYGFRFDGSCWIMPEKSMKSRAITELLAYWKTVAPVEVRGKGMVGVRTHLPLPSPPSRLAGQRPGVSSTSVLAVARTGGGRRGRRVNPVQSGRTHRTPRPSRTTWKA